MLLSILDLCKNIQQPEGVILLNGIQQKVEAMSLQGKKEQII